MNRKESKVKRCQLVDWYSQGESQTVEVDGVCIVIRLVGRKGRRARIAITAPLGAKFSTPPSELEQQLRGELSDT
ncbi:hypothetical protein DTL21_28335 [Bremerella cremea]|uniref:Uncharacterized protein n=1 Tax=Blastopirellula marina TaxID=124 RepID=A0A2S8F8M9_9BACT|nr:MULTISPECIES: hypothetical protein [Pirellulaceae]PQO28511.1 hypothetical protein C5Y83_28285 [Blastopirellula marina]RCS41881.1 hypothetical protein DTL21_28335 [Bremerella cremea]